MTEPILYTYIYASKHFKKLIKENYTSGVLFVRYQQLMQKKNYPCIIMFPGEMYSGSSGDLRAVAIGKELRKHYRYRVIIVPPWLPLKYRYKIIEEESPNYIHLQQSRHPHNDPSLYPNNNCIFDVDDADIIHNENKVIEICRNSKIVIAGNRYLSSYIKKYNKNTHIIWTGTYLGMNESKKSQIYRKPIISWACSDPYSYLEDMLLVKNILLKLSQSHKYIFRIYGIRNRLQTFNYFHTLIDQGIQIEMFPPLKYRTFVETLNDVAIGLQPLSFLKKYNKGKSFGKLLAYMASDVAIIAQSGGDHSLFFKSNYNGILANGCNDIVNACIYLLDNPEIRNMLVNNARIDFINRLTTIKSAELLHIIIKDSV